MNILENFSFERFLSSLQYMWQGMLCIFIVIAAIIISVFLMNFISSKAKARKELKKAEDEHKTTETEQQ